MRLLYVATVAENGPEFVVSADHVSGLLQGQGLLDRPIIIREIPDYLVDHVSYNWDADTWFIKLLDRKPATAETLEDIGFKKV